MSTVSPNAGLPPSAAPAVDYADSRLPTAPGASLHEQEPTYFGLSFTAWLKIGVISLLMILLFRFNLARLWAKTNPFTAQDDNWGHSFLLPFAGLYYLYVWRDSLRKPPSIEAPVASEIWDWTRAWGLFALFGIAAVGCLLAFITSASLQAVLSVRAGTFVLPVLLTGVATIGAVVPALIFRDRFAAPLVGKRLDAAVLLLRTWLMLALCLWGLAFLVAVASFDVFQRFVQPGIAVITLGGLAAIYFLARSDALVGRARSLNASSSVWFGGFVLVFGILFSAWGIYPGQNDFFKDVGMVIALFGVVTLTAGWHVMSIAWFPIALLLCGIPWPDQVYSAVALPLQNLAAKVAVRVLNATGVEAAQQGTKILMMGHDNAVRTLNVAQACAGMKSLMTFVSLATVVAFYSSRPLWQKAVVCSAAVPIAIFCNVMRVSGQGLLDFYVSEGWSTGFAHSFSGLVMLIPGFGLVALICWVLDRLFVEVADDADAVKRKRPPAGKAAVIAPAVSQVKTVPASVTPRSSPAAMPPANSVRAVAATPAPAPAAAPAQPKVIQVPRRTLAPGAAAPARTPGATSQPTQTPRKQEGQP